MIGIGIDIGSTATKVALRGDVEDEFVLPTGWNSKETALDVEKRLSTHYGLDMASERIFVVSTGYGRVSVPYANKKVTEITCHAKGAEVMMNEKDATIIDVGGQDTKVITLQNGDVADFVMNDKCSAGTGKFLEVMANRMGLTLEELFEAATVGTAAKISAMCTVFAESEVIGLMGIGESRDNIAAGVVESVIARIGQLAGRHGIQGSLILTGGLSVNPSFVKLLSEKLGKPVNVHPKGKYAGAIGAAAVAVDQLKRRV